MRERSEREQRPGDGARRSAQRGQDGAPPGMSASERESGGEREADAEREGDAPDPHIGDSRHGEEGRRPPRRRSIHLEHEPLEQQRGREHREHPHQPQSEQRAKRREQEAVAGQMVARVPVLVPYGEAEPAEEIHPVDLRGEVGGARIGDHPRGQQRSRERRREREAVPPPPCVKPGLGPVCYPTGPRHLRRDGGQVPV